METKSRTSTSASAAVQLLEATFAATHSNSRRHEDQEQEAKAQCLIMQRRSRLRKPRCRTSSLVTSFRVVQADNEENHKCLWPRKDGGVVDEEGIEPKRDNLSCMDSLKSKLVETEWCAI
ncbi:hypothetical protein ACFX1X_023729 [Malus domestica]